MDREEDNKTLKQSGKKHFIQYNLNPSNQLLFEDTLKKCIAKFGGSGIHSLKSKYASIGINRFSRNQAKANSAFLTTEARRNEFFGKIR